MNASQNLSEQKTVSHTTYNFARFVLLFLVPLLAFCLTRWVRYDIPNLSKEWQPAPGGLSNAVSFLGASVEPAIGLRGAYISTADGLIYDGALGFRQIDTLSEINQRALAQHQGWKPLIPYTLVPPPGDVIDYYKSYVPGGSLIDHVVAHYVILADGTIWQWTAAAADYVLFGIHVVGGLYALITLLTVLVLLRLERLWRGTWFWRTAVHNQPKLVRRTLLTAVASLIPGITLIGLFSLFEPRQPELIFMALLTALITVPCSLFVRRKAVAISVSVLVAAGAFIWWDGIPDEFYDWQLRLYFYALLVGLLTSLAVIGLVNFFRRTTAVAAV